MSQPSPASRWGESALNHVREIAPAGRGSATAGEKRAAEYVQQQLARMGFSHQTWVQPFEGDRSIGLFYALAFGFTLVGHAAYWLLRLPLAHRFEQAGGGPQAGAWLAVLVAGAAFGFSGFLFWRKLTYRPYPLQNLLPHGPSQNVVAILPAQKDRRDRVVLLAHLDSHRAIWWYAHDVLTYVYLLASPLAVFGLALAPLGYGLATWSGQPAPAWLALCLGALHFIAWFTGATADLGPYSPGANDNASGVGTVLALAERLAHEPLAHTEVWLAFTGCKEVGAEGMAALLDQDSPDWDRKQLREAFFLDFEMVGVGDQFVYLRREGVVRRKTISARVEARLQAAGGALGLRLPSPIPGKGQGEGLGALTEIGAAWKRGYEGACLLARRANSPLPPEWRRLSDQPNRVQASSLEQAHALGWTILKHIDTSDGQPG